MQLRGEPADRDRLVARPGAEAMPLASSTASGATPSMRAATALSLAAPLRAASATAELTTAEKRLE